jgi:hypothetical protein
MAVNETITAAPPTPSAPRRTCRRAARALAAPAFIASLVSGGYLYTAESWGTSSGGEVTAGGGTTSSTWWSGRPERNPDNERALKVWAVVVVALALAALAASWWGPRWLVGVPALLLVALSILGIMSIGILVAPVALLVPASLVCGLMDPGARRIRTRRD